MESVFNSVLNMSITGSYIAAAIMLLRLTMRKLPKRYSYALWAILGVRLLCPFSFSSIVSLFNIFKPKASGGTMTYIPESIKAEAPGISVGIPPVNNAINTAIYDRFASMNAETAGGADPAQTVYFICALLWAAGVAAMLIYTVVSYILVYKRVRSAELLRENIYICKSIETPFVYGIFRPRVYLPESIAEDDIGFILAHERTHIKRGDHIIKLAAMAALCLHWFNPLVWISYRLMTKDMELSCDERAMMSFGSDIRKDYARALLNISAKQNKISLGGILAFGESGTSSRIKNVLNYKKPALWIIIVGIIAVTAAAAVLMTNGIEEADAAERSPAATVSDNAESTVPAASEEAHTETERLARPPVMLVNSGDETITVLPMNAAWDSEPDPNYILQTISVLPYNDAHFSVNNAEITFIDDAGGRIESAPDSLSITGRYYRFDSRGSEDLSESTDVTSLVGAEYSYIRVPEGDYLCELEVGRSGQDYYETAAYRFRVVCAPESGIMPVFRSDDDKTAFDLLGHYYMSGNLLIVPGGYEVCRDYDLFRKYFFGRWSDDISIDDSQSAWLSGKPFGMHFIDMYRVSDSVLAFSCGYAACEFFWLDTSEPDTLYHALGMWGRYPNGFAADDNGSPIVWAYKKTDSEPVEPENGYLSIYRLRELAARHGFALSLAADVEYSISNGILQHGSANYFYPMYLISETDDRIELTTKVGDPFSGIEVDIKITLQRNENGWERTVEEL